MNTNTFTAEQAVLRNMTAHGYEFSSMCQACWDTSGVAGGFFASRALQGAFYGMVHAGIIERMDINKISLVGDYAYRIVR